jgi:hypothetical protein
MWTGLIFVMIGNSSTPSGLIEDVELRAVG